MFRNSFHVQWLNAGAFKISYDVCRSKSLGKSFSYQNWNVMYCHNFSSIGRIPHPLVCSCIKKTMSLKAHTQSYLVVAVHDYSVVGTRGEQYHFLCSN